MVLLLKTTLRQTGAVGGVKCGNNIGIMVFAANPRFHVERETGAASWDTMIVVTDDEHYIYAPDSTKRHRRTVPNCAGTAPTPHS
jgi:hypothetical protein